MATQPACLTLAASTRLATGTAPGKAGNPAIRAQMGHQVPCLDETLCTTWLRAQIGPASRMNTPMIGQGAAVSKALATVGERTGPGFFARMNAPVSHQTTAVHKALAAVGQGTHKGPLSGVAAQVYIQAAFINKTSIAARMRAGPGPLSAVYTHMANQTVSASQALAAVGQRAVTRLSPDATRIIGERFTAAVTPPPFARCLRTADATCRQPVPDGLPGRPAEASRFNAVTATGLAGLAEARPRPTEAGVKAPGYAGWPVQTAIGFSGSGQPVCGTNRGRPGRQRCPKARRREWNGGHDRHSPALRQARLGQRPPVLHTPARTGWLQAPGLRPPTLDLANHRQTDNRQRARHTRLPACKRPGLSGACRVCVGYTHRQFVCIDCAGGRTASCRHRQRAPGRLAMDAQVACHMTALPEVLATVRGRAGPGFFAGMNAQ